MSATHDNADGASAPRTQWLIGPQADLLFIANWTWPLFAVLLWLAHRGLLGDLQLYISAVIGTPHRWLTLGIVANDKDRLLSRWPKLLGTGASTVLLFVGLWWWTRDLGLLILGKYLWNIWHVAAQHAGISRIYAIKCQPEKRASGLMEKYGMRLFIIYAFLRAGSLGGAFNNWTALFGWIQRFSLTEGTYDGLLLLIPAGILINEARSYDRRLLSRYLHMASVLLNYSAMVIFCHLRMVPWALAASGATAVFHATEYFGFVSWSMERRAAVPEGFFVPGLVRNWTITLLAFLYLIAAGSLALAAKFTMVWVVSNTLVAYLHYAYDAVLWKMPAVFSSKRKGMLPGYSEGKALAPNPS